MKKVDKQWIAAKSFIVKDGEVLVLREAPTKGSTKVGYYQVPGGRVELGEPFFDGLKREVKEETGLEVLPIVPLTVMEWYPKIVDVHWHVVAVYYLCDYVSGEVVLSEEHDHHKWIDPREHHKHNTVPNEPHVYEAYLKHIN